MPDPGNRRLLAFDFGTRRIGVASGQEMLGTGQPLAMLPARDGIPDWQQIEALLAEMLTEKEAEFAWWQKQDHHVMRPAQGTPQE